MNLLLSFSRAVDAINAMMGRLIIWLVLAAVLISTANAIVRKAFSISSNAYLEVQWYLYAGVFLLGAGYTMLRQGHVKIDVVLGRFSKRTQIIVECFGIVCFLMPFVWSVIHLVWPLVVNAYVTGESSENAGGLVRWPVFALVPAGFALLGLQGVSEFIKRIAFLAGRGPDPTHPPSNKSAEEELAEEIKKHQVAPQVIQRVEDAVDMIADRDGQGDRK